jgi:hypothetical protein
VSLEGALEWELDFIKVEHHQLAESAARIVLVLPFLLKFKDDYLLFTKFIQLALVVVIPFEQEEV